MDAVDYEPPDSDEEREVTEEGAVATSENKEQGAVANSESMEESSPSSPKESSPSQSSASDVEDNPAEKLEDLNVEQLQILPCRAEFGVAPQNLELLHVEVIQIFWGVILYVRG